MQGAAILASVLGGLMILSLGFLYMSVRPMELPLKMAAQYCRLEPGDKALHAYTGARWLDSQRYFVIQADPATFDERIRKIVATTSSPMQARVIEGPGKDLGHLSEKLPKWWDVESLPAMIAVDVSSTRHNHSGSLTIFSKERGLIYILDR